MFLQEIQVHPKADKKNEKHVGAPMPGEVIDIKVRVGDTIEKGGALIVLSAMKMEMVVQSPIAGKIRSIEVYKGMKMEAEDLLIILD